MQLEKYLINKSKDEARKLHTFFAGVEHLILALLSFDNPAKEVLNSLNIHYQLFYDYLDTLSRKKYMENSVIVNVFLKRIFEKVKEKKSDFNELDVLEEIINNMRDIESQIFFMAGVDSAEVIRKIEDKRKLLLKHNADIDQRISSFTTNLIKEAIEGKLDPVIGREYEIEKLTEILLRRRKNNPIIVGDAGVGKSALVEGLANLIAKEQSVLKEKILLSVDVTNLLAGTKFRGDFEQRVKDLVDFIKEREDIILYIDEFQMASTAGSSSDSNMTLASMLKPELSRGKIQIIASTTHDDYRKFIREDKALSRRFQALKIDEPDFNKSLLILKQLKTKYEEYHKLKITDKALQECINLSKRYITDRYLPDKAIDLMDRALAKKRISLLKLIPDSYNLEIKELYEEEKLKAYAEDYDEAEKLKDKRIKLQNEVEEIIKKDDNATVSSDDIRQVVKEITGVPVSKMTQGDHKHYAKIDQLIRKKVIGQDEAVEKVTMAVKRSRVGLKDENRPIASFLFVGPTGVGKTYLAKTLAKEVFGSEESLIRIDMSEYMEKFQASRIIGSPPGYVGYDRGGELTEKIRKNPYSVVLFDEIEKAHPDIFSLFLQLLDEGYLTDGKSEKADFRNSIIIMTSNIGITNEKIKGGIGFNKQEQNPLKNHILSAVKRRFKPEFLNRLDDIILFNSLKEDQIRQIAKSFLDDSVKKLEKMDIVVKYNVKVLDYLLDKGYSQKYGARNIKRSVVKEIEEKMAQLILDGKIPAHSAINLTIKNNSVNFSNVKTLV